MARNSKEQYGKSKLSREINLNSKTEKNRPTDKDARNLSLFNHKKETIKINKYIKLSECILY